MTVLWAALASSLHVLGIAATGAAFFLRSHFLRRTLDAGGLRRVFRADAVSGIAAVVLIGSGLWRAFGRMEKAPAFYLHNGMFWLKMSLLALILILECIPMITLIRWRAAVRKGQEPDVSGAKRLARVTDVELTLWLFIVFVAPLMARGVWLFG